MKKKKTRVEIVRADLKKHCVCVAWRCRERTSSVACGGGGGSTQRVFGDVEGKWGLTKSGGVVGALNGRTNKKSPKNHVSVFS